MKSNVILNKSINGKEKKQLSASTRALMEVQIRQEEAQQKSMSKFIYIIYMMAVVLLLTMIITHFSSEVAHSKARKLIDTFP
jgi:uncharacterized membrane protein